MKNKKLTYGLLTFVVLLWGAILFKVYKSYFPSEEEVEMAFDEPMNIHEIGENREVYELEPVYNDPFLKNSAFRYSATTTGGQANEKKNEKKLPPPKPRDFKKKINWPQVEYLGRIANKSTETGKGVISINDQENLVEEGEEINNIQVTALYKDSVQLIFKEEKRTFMLKKS